MTVAMSGVKVRLNQVQTETATWVRTSELMGHTDGIVKMNGQYTNNLRGLEEPTVSRIRDTTPAPACSQLETLV